MKKTTAAWFASVSWLFVVTMAVTASTVHVALDVGPISAAPLENESPGDCLAVHRYFPMHDGDTRDFEGPDGEVTISTSDSDFNDRSVYIIGTFGGGECLSYSGTQILFWGESSFGYPIVVLNEPVVWLDEDLLLNGGTRTSRTTASVLGYVATITFTVKVTKLGTVTVPAGTFGNCLELSLSIGVSIPGEGSGTTRQLYVLAPDAGIIRMAPTGELTTWQDLVSGTVDGVDVSTLAPQSLLASPSITQQPLAKSALAGTLVAFRALADGASPLGYQWARNGANLTEGGRISGATNAALEIADLRPEDAGEYAVQVANEVGCVNSREVALTVIADHTRPTLTFTSPSPNSRTSNALALVRGKAADNARVSEVHYQLNDGSWEKANGTTDWEATVELAVGTNRFQAYAADPSGNVSTTNVLRLIFVVTSPLGLSVSGEGTVSPNFNGQRLELGRAYTLTAIPARVSLFSNWIGSVESTLPKLTFIMESNMTLQANFVTNPFVGLKGSYDGLFYDTNAPSHFSAGFFILTLTDNGAFSGKLQQGAAKYSFSGQFDLALSAQKTVPRRGTNEVVVHLQLAAGSDQILGTVSNAAWSSELFGYRADFNSRSNPATNFQGAFTMLLPGAVEPEDGPLGHGFAWLTVSSAGSLSFKGTLGDGSAAVQKVSLATNGQWPFYVGLYSGKGSVLGWLTLVDTPTSDVTGLALWTKPGGVKGALHPAGFTNELETLGSRYIAPAAGTRVLDFTNAVVVLDGGNVAVALTNTVFMSERNKVTVDAPNPQRLSLTLTVSSGAFRGTFAHPQSGKSTPVKGVLLQKQNFGAGFFPGINHSGRVFFGEMDSEERE